MPRNVSSTRRGYGADYERARRTILGPAGNGDLLIDPPCRWCGRIATTADHDPPMEVCGYQHLNLVPACKPCNYARKYRQPRPSSVPSRGW